MRSGSDKKKSFFLLGLISAMNLVSNVAKSDELLGPEIGVLPFAMGRAYSAVADDWLALHYNPAGLSLFEGVDFQITDLAIGINRETISNYSDYADLLGSGSSVDTFRALSGKHLHARLGSTTQLTIPGVAFGLIYQRVIDFENQNLIYPVTSVRDTTDFGFAGGFGFGIGKGANRTKQLRFGLSLKYLRRTGGIKDIDIVELTSSSTSAILDQFSSSGWGVGLTLGMQYQLPINSRAEYTFSFVYHDIGNTSFGSNSDSDRPTRIEQNMIAGMAARFPIGGAANRRVARRFGHPRSSSALTLAFDYSHINVSLNQEQFAKRLHFGMNLALPIVSMQVGLNQSKISFGAGVDLGALKIQGASYAEELGSYAGQRADRRYLLSIATGIGFSKL